MEGNSSGFPFSKSFQFRKHEAAALEGLFERSFFDAAYSPEALEALRQNRFRPGESDGEDPAEGRNAGGASGAADWDLESLRSVILCRGADGMGKTRIFRHLRERARARSIPVYETSNYDVEGVPLKPFLQTIRGILRDMESGSSLLEKYRYALESLLPEIYRGHSVQGKSSTDESLARDKVRIFDGLTQLILEVAAQKPLLVLVHDLHWGDLASVELLRHIGRNVLLRNRMLRSRRDAGSRSGGSSKDAAGGSGNGGGRVPARRASRRAPDEALSAAAEISHGPEFEDFDSDEWRALAPRSVAPGVYGSMLDNGGRPASHTGGGGGEASADIPRPVRLLILANYRAFDEQDHFIQEAIDRLGTEDFAYHCELLPLRKEEVGDFVRKSVEGVVIGGRPLEVTPDAVETIHAFSEGFPSFQQELFRGLFLADGERSTWTDEFVRGYLGVESSEAAPETETAANDETPPAEPSPPGAPRQAILRRRLADCSETERRILEVLAVARRPVQPVLIHRLLSSVDGETSEDEAPERPDAALTLEDTERILSSLDHRGLVERSDRACPGGSTVQPEAYSFHLWDYTRVVEASVEPERRPELHRRLAVELRSCSGDPEGEGAYEIYYHYRRSTESLAAVDFGMAAGERFVGSFAVQRARLLYRELLGLLEGEEGLEKRLVILEKIARTSVAIKDYGSAEEACRQIQQEEHGALEPQARLALLVLEAEIVGESDPARALKILGKAPRLLKDEVSPEGARLHLAIARLRFLRQDWKRAINLGLKGVAICQKLADDLPEQSKLYQLMGRAFYRKGDYAHAVDNYQRGLEAAERQGDRAQMVACLDELGRVYLERGEYFRSARYLYKSLEIRRRDQDVVGLCRSYDQLGLCYQRNGDYLKTIESLNRSLRLKERTGDIEGLNPTLGTLGDLYVRLGHYQRAIVYFRREMDNSRALKASKLDETVWLADAFVRLGRVYFELGEIKQAESLCKQALILASEFKLRSKEADGMLLEGNLKAFHREWAAAEKSLKWASEALAKLGHRRREASAVLDLGEVKFLREQYDEALKLASRAQIIADEIKALDLQVRALTLKGNVHRFLKGGNADKVKEHFNKALELGQNLSDVTVLFELFYSLAKVQHTDREFTDAANYYGKAESILKRVVEFLPEDLSARFQEDRRRKVFEEDVARFRREAHSRSTLAETRERGLTGADLRDRPAGVSDYKDLLARILRANQSISKLHFYERLLAEGVELAGADRGVILRVQKREYLPVAFQGFGSNPTQHSEYAAASQLTEEAIRRGKSIVVSGGEGNSVGRFIQLGALAGRSVMVVPLMTDERIFGGVYVDKPESLGRFATRERVLMETFAEHAGVALQSRRQLDVAIQEPLTGFFTPSYFIDRLREAYRWFNLHGKVFSLAGFYLPVLDNALGEGREGLGEKLSKELGDLLPYRSAVCWGSPILYILLNDTNQNVAQEVARRVSAKLESLLAEEVPVEVIAADRQYQQGAEIYFEVRRKLLPEDCDQKTLTELRRLLSKEVTIKEAKRILEKNIIERTLRKTGGNITHAARQLGIHRPQLSNLLKKYSLKREIFEQPVEKSLET